MTIPEKQLEFEELILKAIDGECTEFEFEDLNNRLRLDPAAMEYYLEFILFSAKMQRSGEVAIQEKRFQWHDDVGLTELWMALAEDERTAEAVEDVQMPEPAQTIPVCRGHIVASRQKVSMFPLYTAMSLIAALLLVIAYVATHPRKIPNAVATLTGSRGAVWRQAINSAGDKRLYTDSTMTLIEGFAEITFDNQAKIIVQSPAEFNLEDYNQIYLRSGKISAIVPPPAKGFVVRTAGASIVDYGTEFGVTADEFGYTEAHVFVGQIELRSGSDPICFEAGKRLTAGQSSYVRSGVISQEPMLARPSSYVRQLPEKTLFSLPGKRLDLADIVGGGNGFGTGQKCIGIDPGSGDLTTELVTDVRGLRSYQYYPVPEVPCIDGVFVPLGGESLQIITSQGHLFEQCPKTDGSYWIEITNRPVTTMSLKGDPNPKFQLARLNGIQYGSAMHPAIMMHANTGITFDLDAIRSTIPGAQIQRFTSLCGLSETLADTGLWGEAVANMWVLVDGQQRKSIKISWRDKKYAFVNVNITENDRFLTLVATDGENNNGGDWTLFGDPALELEQVDF